MQTELKLSPKAFRLDGKKIPLGDCQSRRAANRSIGGIACRIERNNHIVAVVAAAEENANECFVAGPLCKRLHQPKTIDSRGKHPDRQHPRNGPAEEFST